MTSGGVCYPCVLATLCKSVIAFFKKMLYMLCNAEIYTGIGFCVAVFGMLQHTPLCCHSKPLWVF
uniref:Uncharacterized protein n=1 Tax=Anguilla anguilla TaxID=7936 RepID=A0A0E9SHA4_ANGAN